MVIALPDLRFTKMSLELLDWVPFVVLLLIVVLGWSWFLRQIRRGVNQAEAAADEAQRASFAAQHLAGIAGTQVVVVRRAVEEAQETAVSAVSATQETAVSAVEAAHAAALSSIKDRTNIGVDAIDTSVQTVAAAVEEAVEAAERAKRQVELAAEHAIAAEESRDGLELMLERHDAIELRRTELAAAERSAREREAAELRLRQTPTTAQ